MTFGSSSKMFVAWAQGVMGQGQTSAVLPAASGNASSLYQGLGSDTVKVALFNDTTTPDNTAARTSTGFNTGVWTHNAGGGNEVIDSAGSNWPTGGQTLASKTLTTSTNVFTFSAANLAGSGNVTISNAYGCFLYDDNITAGTGGVADQGICFNAFGSGQSVTAGTFTIVWNGSGIFTVTCS